MSSLSKVYDIFTPSFRLFLSLSLHWLLYTKEELVWTNIQTATMAEKYTHNWHTFSDHLKLMFKDLYQEGRYTDVTLVSDDHYWLLWLSDKVEKEIQHSHQSSLVSYWIWIDLVRNKFILRLHQNVGPFYFRCHCKSWVFSQFLTLRHLHLGYLLWDIKTISCTRRQN